MLCLYTVIHINKECYSSSLFKTSCFLNSVSEISAFFFFFPGLILNVGVLFCNFLDSPVLIHKIP